MNLGKQTLDTVVYYFKMTNLEGLEVNDGRESRVGHKGMIRVWSKGV